ncbi:MAG: hypothetical protein ABSD71_09700 [Bacteroidales bacterium]|jgi:hypothetical protein
MDMATERITELQAIRSVTEGVKENEIQVSKTLNQFLENREMSHAMFIENLEDPEKSYFLVYWMVNDRILCIAEVDAVQGIILSFTPFTHPGAEHYHNFMKAEEIVHDKFHEDEIIESSLVWRPCLESSSSLFPFRRVRTKEHTYFMSISGDFYSELTPVG